MMCSQIQTLDLLPFHLSSERPGDSGRQTDLSKHRPQLTVASLIAQSVKTLPAVQETRVQFLGWEDPLEKEMATHSSSLAWRIPWAEEPGRLQSMGMQELDTAWRLAPTHSKPIVGQLHHYCVCPCLW